MKFTDLLLALIPRVHWVSFPSSVILLPSRLLQIFFLLILGALKVMLTLFARPKDTKEEAPLTITDEERERLKALLEERGLTFERYYRFGRMNEPSLVLDDFLFLGNMQHASNRELLGSFNISECSSASQTQRIHCFSPLEHIINVCDLTLSAAIVGNFDVVHIPMPDEPQTNIKQVRRDSLRRDLPASSSL